MLYPSILYKDPPVYRFTGIFPVYIKRSGKRMVKVFSRDFENCVYIIVASDPKREWVNRKGERHYHIVKSKSGEATTDEIKHNLDIWGISWSKTSLGRKLQILREKDLIRQGVTRGVYVVTRKGLEEFSRRELEFVGLGALNTIPSDDFDGLYSVNVDQGEIKSIDLYARFHDEKFINDFLVNVKNKIEGFDFDEAVKSKERITFSFDPYNRRLLIRMYLQTVSMLAFSTPAEQIRFLQEMGADDEVLQKMYDAFKDS
jgi:hypothetical protein